jgi:hypothetical protein
VSQTQQSPLDTHRAEIERWISEGLSYSEVISNLATLCKVPTTERSIRRALKRWDVKRPGETPQAERSGITYRGDDEAEITGKATTGFSTPEDLMRERGLNTEDWEVAGMTVNEWDGVDGAINRQLKCHLKRKKPSLLFAPARIDGPTYKRKLVKPKKGEARTVVLVGDQQAPYQNQRLHDQFCRWLDHWQPHEGVLIGDTIDLPDISRHPDTPEEDAPVQECVDSGYICVRDYTIASTPTRWKKLAGNHDERIRRAQIDRLRQMYGLRRAQVPGEDPETPVVDVGHLLRLDELGIEYIRPDGDYQHSQVKLSPLLAARHGWIARKGSGASALSTLDHLGFSVVVGHTHRQSLVHKTTHDINGDLTTLAACETGCMCRVEGGLGYAVAPDWQNGFATASIWDDGTFKIDLATYVNDVLYYRNERYS